MSRVQVEQVTCDVCRHEPLFPSPSDFKTVTSPAGAQVDLCQRCAQPGFGLGTIECGQHKVTVTSNEAWQCSCGVVYGAVVLGMRMAGVPLDALNAVPSLLHATARLHVEGI